MVVKKNSVTIFKTYTSVILQELFDNEFAYAYEVDPIIGFDRIAEIIQEGQYVVLNLLKEDGFLTDGVEVSTVDWPVACILDKTTYYYQKIPL